MEKIEKNEGVSVCREGAEAKGHSIRRRKDFGNSDIAMVGGGVCFFCMGLGGFWVLFWWVGGGGGFFFGGFVVLGQVSGRGGKFLGRVKIEKGGRKKEKVRMGLTSEGSGRRGVTRHLLLCQGRGQ